MPGFLVEYHRKRGDVSVEEYDSLMDALVERLRRDRMNHDPDLEIASIGANSRGDLERSHSRYFLRAGGSPR